MLAHIRHKYDDVRSRPPSNPNMPKSVFCPGVFVCFVLCPPILRSASSFIRCILLTAMKTQCSTYIKHSTVKQGGSQQRRSSRCVPATGLHKIHQHIGLVSRVSLYSFTIPPLSHKCRFPVQSWEEKHLLILSQLNKLPFLTFCTLCCANDKIIFIYHKRGSVA